MSLRKRAYSRMLALQAVCLYDSLGESFADDLDTFLHDAVNYGDLGWKQPPEPELLSFARALATGAWEHRAGLDDVTGPSGAGALGGAELLCQRPAHRQR